MKLLPHLFSYDERTILFDARTYAIMEVQPWFAEALRLLSGHRVAVAKQKFVRKFPIRLWEKCYRILKILIKEKYLSVEDDDTSRPLL